MAFNKKKVGQPLASYHSLDQKHSSSTPSFEPQVQMKFVMQSRKRNITFLKKLRLISTKLNALLISLVDQEVSLLKPDLV